MFAGRATLGGSGHGLRALAFVAATQLSSGHAPPPATTIPRADACPVRVGERATYSARYGVIPIGHAVIVSGADTLRGRPVWHISINVLGGIPFFRVDERIESWVDPDSMYALRFVEHLHQGRESWVKEFDFHPERREMVTEDGTVMPSVAEPLDDASLLFLMRHEALETGRTYESRRYFWPQANPVRVTVARRERVEVPAGTFDAVVLQPRIATSTVFRESAQSEVHLADDASHLLLRLSAHMPFANIKFALRSVEYDSVPAQFAHLNCGRAALRP